MLTDSGTTELRELLGKATRTGRDGCDPRQQARTAATLAASELTIRYRLRAGPVARTAACAAGSITVDQDQLRRDQLRHWWL